MRKGFLPWILGAAMVLPACTGYQELKKDWEGYKPSPFYQDYAKPGLSKPISPLPPDGNFEGEVQKLKERKKKWEDSLKAPEKEADFYRPDPARFSALLPLGEALSLAQEMLAKGFTLEDLEIVALLRNPGVKAAGRNLQASIEAYSQVWNLDEILRQYSAFSEGLMTGIGSMEGGNPWKGNFLSRVFYPLRARS